MLENFLNPLIALVYSRVRAIVSKAIEEGVEHGSLDAMHKLGLKTDPPPASQYGQASAAVASQSDSGVPSLMQSKPALPASHDLAPRKRGRPPKVAEHENPNHT